VFLICHRRNVFPLVEGEARAWLAVCAYRVASNHRNRMYMRTERPYDESAAPVLAPRWDEEIDAIRLVSGALAQLDATHRAVVVLAHLEEVPLTEIAVRLGMPWHRVRAAFFEAQRAMMVWIKRQFLLHSAASTPKTVVFNT